MPKLKKVLRQRLANAAKMNEIRPRTVCVQCPTCLCLACSAASPHDHHYMVRVPAGRDQKEVVVLLQKLRDLTHTPPAPQETEDTGRDARDIIKEELPDADTSAATEAGALLVECKQEAPDEEEDAMQAGQDELEVHVSYMVSDALDPIGLDIKQEIQDETEEITMSLKSEPSSALTKRKLVDDPQIPGHSQSKHLMMEFQSPNQRDPGDISNILNTSNIKHTSSKKQKIGTDDGPGRTGGKGVNKRKAKPIIGNNSNHKTDDGTLETAIKHTSIQGTTESLHSELNLSSVNTEKSTDDVERMDEWSEEDGGVRHEREVDAAVENTSREALTRTVPVVFKISGLKEESSP